MQAAKDTLENEFERKDVTPEREEQNSGTRRKNIYHNKKVIEQENDIEQAKPVEKDDLTKVADQILEEPVQETLDVMAGYETNQKESEADVSTIEEDDYPF